MLLPFIFQEQMKENTKKLSSFCREKTARHFLLQLFLGRFHFWNAINMRLFILWQPNWTGRLKLSTMFLKILMQWVKGKISGCLTTTVNTAFKDPFKMLKGTKQAQ